MPHSQASDVIFDLSLESKLSEEWVQIAFSGKFLHPATGQTVELSAEDFQEWKRYLEYLKKYDETIPVVSGHSREPSDRLGTLSELRLGSEGTKVFGKVTWTNKEYREKTKLASFSIWAKRDHATFDGTKFSSALIHVGVTDYPVLKGLKRRLDEKDTYYESVAFSEFLSGITAYSQYEETDMADDTAPSTLKAENEVLKKALSTKDEELSELRKSIVGVRKNARQAQIDGLKFSEEEKKSFASLIDPLLSEPVILADAEDKMFASSFESLKAIKGSSRGEQFSTGNQEDSDSVLDETGLVAYMKSLSK